MRIESFDVSQIPPLKGAKGVYSTILPLRGAKRV
jgi:hypothetical protein